MDLNRRLESASSHGAIASFAGANAGGRNGAAGQARIFDQVSELPLRGHEKKLILDALRHPGRVESLAVAVQDPAVRATVYQLFLQTVDGDCPAGRVYLEDLAEIFALSPVLVRSLREQTLGQGRWHRRPDVFAYRPR